MKKERTTLILPAFNIKIEGIEYEKPKPVIPNKTYNENRAQRICLRDAILRRLKLAIERENFND